MGGLSLVVKHVEFRKKGQQMEVLSVDYHVRLMRVKAN